MAPHDKHLLGCLCLIVGVAARLWYNGRRAAAAVAACEALVLLLLVLAMHRRLPAYLRHRARLLACIAPFHMVVRRGEMMGAGTRCPSAEPLGRQPAC